MTKYPYQSEQEAWMDQCQGLPKAEWSTEKMIVCRHQYFYHTVVYYNKDQSKKTEIWTCKFCGWSRTKWHNDKNIPWNHYEGLYE